MLTYERYQALHAIQIRVPGEPGNEAILADDVSTSLENWMKRFTEILNEQSMNHISLKKIGVMLCKVTHGAFFANKTAAYFVITAPPIQAIATP